MPASTKSHEITGTTSSSSNSERKRRVEGYDVIGDVHGCATALEELLRGLDYRVKQSSGAYEHPERQAVFVGDLVDRGAEQLSVIHACWHEPSMRVVEKLLGSDRFTSRNQFVRATTTGDALYEAIEVLLKGPEIDLAGYGQQPYYDKDGHARSSARVAWWRDGATTLRELGVMDGNFTTEDGEPYPALPDIEVAASERSFSYREDLPVFYGHYLRQGQPRRGVDFTERTACVDFSAIKTGTLVAYRWDGESEIRADHYVNVVG